MSKDSPQKLLDSLLLFATKNKVLYPAIQAGRFLPSALLLDPFSQMREIPLHVPHSKVIPNRGKLVGTKSVHERNEEAESVPVLDR